MRPATCGILLGLIALFVALTACPSPGRQIREPSRGYKTGRLVVYFQGPETLTADVTVTLASVSAVDERGILHPVVTEPRRLEASAMVGRQVLLSEVALAAGHYQGLHFTFSEAFIRRGNRKANLALPSEGWTLEAPFRVSPRDSATLFLFWDPARSLEMGFFFSPHLKAGREVRQIRQLLVYVTNEDSDTVSVINRDTGRVVATLAVPRGPRGLASSSNGEHLYVVSTDASRLTHFRTNANERITEHRFEFGAEPQQVAVSPDGSRLFVTLFQLNRLIILDAGSLTWVGEAEVGRGPTGVLVEPAGRKVYVANSLSNDVSIVSAHTGALLATVSAEPNPHRLAVTSDGREVLVTGYNSTRLTSISVTSNQVTRRLNAGRWIADIAVDPRLNRFYLVQDKVNRLLYYEPTSQLAIQTIPVRPSPFRVTLDPDLRTLLVVSRDTNTVTLIDRITGEVEGVLEVGKNPYDIVVVEVP